MKIAGIEKTSLIDYPGKIACTLFAHGCNFRCSFCHNPELILEAFKQEIPKKQILDFLENRKEKLEGVCITGGEPLMFFDESDKEFLSEIKKKKFSIKIDTNGSFPEKLKEILDENLADFVAMDIKSDRENYDKITNVNSDIKKIEQSILLVASAPDYEFRTTVVGGLHTIEIMENISIWLNSVLGHKPKKFVLQGFKNKGKLIDAQFKMKKDVSEDFLKGIKRAIEGYFGEVEIRV
jgi:pyruvate formate lyase activating enzyme